ncbi:MAG: PQQ-dependent sugar dehydrogenase, partial [Ignavibacteriae bacterium]|nr:PQQ-dependent sugar dehydrogenase [Ignavibacteriota bacterium]
MNRAFSAALLMVSVLASLHHTFAQQFRLDTLAQSPGVALPVAMAFVPGQGGSFFFTEKNSGKVKLFADGAVREKPFLALSVATIGEQGLLGVALHPRYPDSPFVY